MKTVLVILMMSISGCATVRDFVGMTPTECEAKAEEIQARVEKVTAQMCTAQQDYKARASILDAALETVSK